MNRRKFLAFLAAVPAFCRLSGATTTPEKGYAQGHVQYKGYNIYWTGYKLSQSTDRLIGQWVAYGEDKYKPHYYMGTNGFGGTFKPGDYFETTLLSGWEVVNSISSEEHKEIVRYKTYQHLLKVIK